MRPRGQHLAAFAASLVLLFGCRTADDSSVKRATSAPLPMFGVVLPASEAPHLLAACDGKTASADSLWSPPDSTLKALEVRLAQHLISISRTDSLQAYSRQYLGLYRGGRKLIFVKGVHRSYLTGAVAQDSAAGISRSESVARVQQWLRTSAVRVCDGGMAFFRAEYDVTVDRIAYFSFNAYES